MKNFKNIKIKDVNTSRKKLNNIKLFAKKISYFKIFLNVTLIVCYFFKIYNFFQDYKKINLR